MYREPARRRRVQKGITAEVKCPGQDILLGL